MIAWGWMNRYSGEYVIKVAPAEYQCTYLYNTGVARAYINNGPGTQVHFTNFNIGARTAIDIAPAFNHVIILDDQHYPWINAPTGTPSTNNTCIRYDTDSSGAAFNYIYRVWAFFNAIFGASGDSTQLYHWAVNDSYKWVDNTGSAKVKPYLIWTAPSGRKIANISAGLVLMILLDNGDVYERGTGASSFTKVTFPAGSYCVGVASSYRDFRFYLVHNYAGGDATLGKLEWAGSEQGVVGDVASRTTPYLLSFTLPYNIRQVVANDNTFHYIDSIGDMYGGGDNAQGEVGNGIEIVNRYDYWNWCCNTPYAWSTDKGQLYTWPPVKIGAGHKWKRLYDQKGFAFYGVASDEFDSLYNWGRSKGFVTLNYTANNEATYANCFDKLTPTLWSPMSNLTGYYIDFKLPKCHAGGDKTVTALSTTMGGLDTAANTGIANLYSIMKIRWSQKSGPNTAVFSDSTAASVTVSNLTTGTYKFYKKITDNNTGTWADSVTLTVNNTASRPGCWIRKSSFKRKHL